MSYSISCVSHPKTMIGFWWNWVLTLVCPQQIPIVANRKQFSCKFKKIWQPSPCRVLRKEILSWSLQKKTEIIKLVKWLLWSHSEGNIFSCVPVKQNLSIEINLLPCLKPDLTAHRKQINSSTSLLNSFVSSTTFIFCRNDGRYAWKCSYFARAVLGLP